jgi:hypothetical protein
VLLAALACSTPSNYILGDVCVYGLFKFLNIQLILSETKNAGPNYLEWISIRN